MGMVNLLSQKKIGMMEWWNKMMEKMEHWNSGMVE
jgi:hypothetical protein